MKRIFAKVGPPSVLWATHTHSFLCLSISSDGEFVRNSSSRILIICVGPFSRSTRSTQSAETSLGVTVPLCILVLLALVAALFLACKGSLRGAAEQERPTVELEDIKHCPPSCPIGANTR